MSIVQKYRDPYSALNMPRPSTVIDDGVFAKLDRTAGVRVTKTLTCDGNGAQTDNVFTVTGRCDILRIYAICTEATDATTFQTAYIDIYDGTAALEITDNGGTDLSGITVGSLISKDLVATSAIVLKNSSAGTFTDGGGAGFYTTFCPFRVGKKSGVDTYIRFCFTGDANTDVDMKFYIDYIAMTDDGAIAAV